MRITPLIAGAVSSAVAMVAITAVFAQSGSNDGKRYLPEYTESGDLILPKNFNDWVYVGSPLTPEALSTFAFGNYPLPLGSDVEWAFHPCNISSKETNN